MDEISSDESDNFSEVSSDESDFYEAPHHEMIEHSEGTEDWYNYMNRAARLAEWQREEELAALNNIDYLEALRHHGYAGLRDEDRERSVEYLGDTHVSWGDCECTVGNEVCCPLSVRMHYAMGSQHSREHDYNESPMLNDEIECMAGNKDSCIVMDKRNHDRADYLRQAMDYVHGDTYHHPVDHPLAKAHS